MEKEYFYAISYDEYDGRNYFNGFRKHATENHLMIKESKSPYVRKSFMKWKNVKYAYKYLQKIKDWTKESFRDYNCKIEKIELHDGLWRTVEYVKL